MPNERNYHVALVGATGAVGKQIIKTLEERDFPLDKLTLLASARSAGREVPFKGETLTIQEAQPDAFEGVDIAFFSAGGSVSSQLAHEAVERGAVVIDNTSAFRLDPEVPLVVPEVNEEDIAKHKGIIANPNCSTIQMVVALKPLQERYGMKRLIVSTYQAVSGAGNKAIEELNTQTEAILKGEAYTPEVLPVASDKKKYPIAFNAVPQIDVFQENDYTKEEMKMVNETKKILHDDSLQISTTCVRLPVVTGHSESVYVELEEKVHVEDVRQLLAESAGIIVQDKPEEQLYPLASNAAGRSEVFVGRIRKDLDVDNGLHFWVVADNLIKGAAHNSVQIAEAFISNYKS